MTYPNLSTELLRTFVTVVDVDGFIRASETLHKTQSTVSQHIKRLEQELGEVLFMAAGRKRVLSPSGEILITYARRMLALQDDAVRAVRQTGIEETLSIGLSHGIGEGVLPELLGQFSRSYPGVKLNIETAYSEEILSRYERGEFHLTLTLEQQPSGGDTLATEDLVWIGATGFSWDGQRPLPLASFTAPCSILETTTTALNDAGIAFDLTYKTTSLPSLMAAVRAGFAIAVRARHAVTAGTEVLTPRLPLPPMPKASIVMRHRSSAAASDLLASVIQGEILRVA